MIHMILMPSKNIKALNDYLSTFINLIHLFIHDIKLNNSIYLFCLLLNTRLIPHSALWGLHQEMSQLSPATLVLYNKDRSAAVICRDQKRRTLDGFLFPKLI